MLRVGAADRIEVLASQLGLRSNSVAEWVALLLADWAAAPQPGRDETLVAVLQSENRERACVSYVLPLLEAVGLIELERARPARARLRST